MYIYIYLFFCIFTNYTIDVIQQRFLDNLGLHFFLINDTLRELHSLFFSA